MAAIEAVLNTVELLEGIILQIPPELIPRLQFVSRHWKKVIKSPIRIHHYYQSRVRAPTHWSATCSTDGIPVYGSSTNIEPHPALSWNSKVTVHPTQPKMIEFVFDRADFHAQDIIEFQENFATTPPCQYMEVCHLRSKHGASLYVKERIKIADLLKRGHEEGKIVDQQLVELLGGVPGVDISGPIGFTLRISLMQELTQAEREKQLQAKGDLWAEFGW
jgi:hypothetical protein